MSHIGGEKKGSLRINPVDFFCRCSKEAFVSKVRLLDRSELEELVRCCRLPLRVITITRDYTHSIVPIVLP